MMNEKLKPCPFCGSHDVHCSSNNIVVILCKKCGAYFRIRIGNDKNSVIELWNRRVAT